MKIHIVICTEPGKLEKLSMLLVFSLRYFLNGNEIEIHSYNPRMLDNLSSETNDFFEKNNVVQHNILLNEKYKDYPLANKPLVCSYHENKFETDYILFIDSDTVFIDFPSLLHEIPSGCDVFIRPVDYMNIATDINFKIGEKSYWENVYKLLNISRRKKVVTAVDKKNILEYYNSGFVFAKSNLKLFTTWKENFELIFDSKIFPQKGRYFVEQSSLSATIAQMDLNVCSCEKGYGFPISTYLKKWRGYYPFSIENIKHIHYHKLFDSKELAVKFKRKIKNSKNGMELTSLINNLFEF